MNYSPADAARRERLVLAIKLAEIACEDARLALRIFELEHVEVGRVELAERFASQPETLAGAVKEVALTLSVDEINALGIDREHAVAVAKGEQGYVDPFAEPAEFSQGLYSCLDGGWDEPGQLYYVYRAQAGHWLAKRVVRREGGFALKYEGAAGRFTSPERRLPAAAQAEFGQLAGWCGFCATDLSDPDSQRLGYGPICAKKNGLHHPNA